MTAQFPSSTPKFIISQIGDGGTSIRVHVAQANAARTGLAIVAGPEYDVNRGLPNNAGVDQLHHNVKGYTVDGEKEARALASELSGVPFKPTMINSVEWADAYTVRLKCSTPNGGGLVIDTTNLPECPGYGIDIEKPDFSKIVPSSVTISGNDIICRFDEIVWPSYRVRVGYTRNDITQDGTASGNYLPCTNIRGAVGNVSKSGIVPIWYDWLLLDRQEMVPSMVGYVKPGVLGPELWRVQKYGLTDGLLTAVTFDGTNMVVMRNGITNAPVTTAAFVDGGTNVDGLYWPVKTGKNYRVTVDKCQITSGAGLHEIRIYVGNAIIKRQSTNNGTLAGFTQDVTAVADGILTLQLNNAALVGQISGISVREIL